MKLPPLQIVIIWIFLLSIGHGADQTSILSGFKIEALDPSSSIELEFDDSKQAIKTRSLKTENFKNSLLPTISVPWEPQGKILETDDVRAIGLQVPRAIATNSHGEHFVLDSNSERSQIFHVVDGGDYGWRRGTAKKPTYFEDVLPPILELDSEQTMLISGAKTNYPSPYQQSLFTVGQNNIHIINLVSEGSSYTGNKKLLFTSDQPIINTAIHSDGLLYFQTNLGIYKIAHNDTGSPVEDSDNSNARQLRENIASFHNKVDSSAIDIAWPSLSNSDRVLRQTARLAIESQPISEWQDKALAEEEPQAIISAAIALTRAKSISHPIELQKSIIDKLVKLEFDSLPETQQLGLLRAYSLTFSRLSKPTPIQRAKLIAALDKQLPSKSEPLNQELLKLLVYLKASTTIEKGIKLIESPDTSDSAKASFALHLSYLEKGWTMEQRQSYFQFLIKSKSNPNPYLDAVYVQALAGCTDEEREALSALTGENYDPIPNFSISSPEGPGKNWTFEQAIEIGHDNKEASFENGRSLYFSIGCASCHRMNGLGGGIGPDLSAIPHISDIPFVVESILAPNKDITTNYDSSRVTFKDGTSTVGIAVERGDELRIYAANAYKKPKIVTLDKVSGIEPIEELSQMPTGLLTLLNEDEVRDLLAYLMAGGKAANFDSSSK